MENENEASSPRPGTRGGQARLWLAIAAIVSVGAALSALLMGDDEIGWLDDAWLAVKLASLAAVGALWLLRLASRRRTR